MGDCAPVRPALSPNLPADVFWNWYWTREELAGFCKGEGLRQDGSKADLFARAQAYLSGQPDPTPKRRRLKGAVNWARDPLSLDTVIDGAVSFGPNLRRFMAEHIGPGFVCHGDFMGWVRAHPGHTLADAVAAWQALEARKADPAFRREIATDNQYLKYVRDYMDANPARSADEARATWLRRRAMPAPGGRIVYKSQDQDL